MRNLTRETFGIRAVLFILFLLVLFRLVPHPPNVSPLLPVALFCGASFIDRRIGMVVPLAGLFISDVALGFYADAPYVYLSVAAVSLLGAIALTRLSIVRLIGITLIATMLFYLVTNFGSWLHHDLYPKNAAGLVQAYVAGLPFLRNSLLGNLIFTMLVFYGSAPLNSFLNKLPLPFRARSL